MTVEIDNEEGRITINDNFGVVTEWNKYQWGANPDLVTTMVEVIQKHNEKGPGDIRRMLGRRVAQCTDCHSWYEEPLWGEAIEIPVEKIKDLLVFIKPGMSVPLGECRCGGLYFIVEQTESQEEYNYES